MRSKVVIFGLCALLIASAVAAMAPKGVAAPTTDSSLNVSMSSVPTAVDTQGNLAFTISYDLPQASSWTSAEVRLLDQDGKTILYQSEWVDAQPLGPQTLNVVIKLSGRSVHSDVYTLQASLKSSFDSSASTGKAEATVSIYDGSLQKVPVAFFVRAQTMILTDVDGNFVEDPAKNQKTLDSIYDLAQAVNQNPNLTVAVGIAPIMIEEWSTISKGYTYLDGDEKVEVKATEDTPKKYDQVLSTLAMAAATKRLSIAPVAYTDPGLVSLAAEDLTDDINTQYKRGIGISRSLGTTETASGTIPFDLALPLEASNVLSTNELGWSVVSSTSLKPVESGSSETTPTSGAWKIKGSSLPLTALVNDDDATAAVSRGDRAALLARIMDRYNEQESAGSSSTARQMPLIITANISEDSTVSVANILDLISGEPWITLTSAEIASKSAEDSVELLPSEAQEQANTSNDFWANVQEARKQATSLEAIAEPEQEEAARATKNSLISESAAFQGTEESRGLTFARDATDVANSILDKIDIKVEPVTLSKDSGEVPLVISNGTLYTLSVKIHIRAESGLSLNGTVPTEMKLYPNDNYITVPVALDPNETSGDLRVDVLADTEVIDHSEVAIKGSLVGRTVMLVGIALILVLILVFIRRRVRSVERSSKEDLS